MIAFNVNCYNIDIAKLYGIMTAVLLSYIDKSYEYALRRSTINKNNTFSVSRQNIYHATGLTKEEQETAEKMLTKQKILEVFPFKEDYDRVYYKYHQNNIVESTKQLEAAQNMQELMNTLFVENKEKAEKVHRTTKRDKEIQILKSSIKEENSALKQLIFDWIDAMYNRNFSITTAAMKINLEQIKKYDADTKTKILYIAIKNGYRDIQWAIDAVIKSESKEDRNWKTYSSMQPDESTVVSKEQF